MTIKPTQKQLDAEAKRTMAELDQELDSGEQQSPTDNFLQNAENKLREMGSELRQERAVQILAEANHPIIARQSLNIGLAKTRLLPGWEHELETILQLEIKLLVLDLTARANKLKRRQELAIIAEE